MALITQAELEQFSQIDFTAEPDTAVALWIDAASAAIESYCGRAFEHQSGVVETLDGNRNMVLLLSRTPVTAINTVTEDGTPLPSEDYQWYPDGRLYRMSGDYRIGWTWKRQAVVVDYDGGYTNIPADIKAVAARFCERIFLSGAEFAAQPAGVKTVSMEDESVTYRDPAAALGEYSVFPTGDLRILNKYRRRA